MILPVGIANLNSGAKAQEVADGFLMVRKMSRDLVKVIYSYQGRLPRFVIHDDPFHLTFREADSTETRYMVVADGGTTESDFKIAEGLIDKPAEGRNRLSRVGFIGSGGVIFWRVDDRSDGRHDADVREGEPGVFQE